MLGLSSCSGGIAVYREHHIKYRFSRTAEGIAGATV